MADPTVKQLRIKTGVVKRLAKEKSVYEKELESQKKKIDDMKAGDHDAYAIKKMGELVQETETVLPDAKRRLKKAYEDLDSLVKGEGTKCMETEEYKAATAMLEENKAVEDL